MEDAPFYFWVPAFKAHADLYLRLIRRMTLFQWQGELGQQLGSLKCHPVTLPADEGVESLKTALASWPPTRGTCAEHAQIGIAMKEADSRFVPFGQGAGALQPQIPLRDQREGPAVRADI
jgi:hypothetical protein